MRRSVPILTLLVTILGAVNLVIAQDKKVRIAKLEIDGKAVKAKFKVNIITADKKVYNAKTDEDGFIVPAEVLSKWANNYVGVLITFKKITLTFFAVHTSNFDTEWKVVGIDTEPFEPERLGDADPAQVQAIYYIQFAGEPERNMTVKASKPKVTIQRINDD